MSPGGFKERANRAGSTEFVAPGLVEGTLRSGFETGGSLTSPFARAVFMMLLVSEVHPFADGNGRIARMMMSVHAGELRIVIPTVYRLNYLAVLRAATHTSNDAALVAALALARRSTARINLFRPYDGGDRPRADERAPLCSRGGGRRSPPRAALKTRRLRTAATRARRCGRASGHGRGVHAARAPQDVHVRSGPSELLPQRDRARLHMSVMGEADGPSESPVRAPIRGHDFGNPQTHASIRSATCCQPTSSIMSCPIRGKISASDR